MVKLLTITMGLLILTFSSCVTTREYQREVTDPFEEIKMKDEFRSNQDYEYFDEVQKNNRDAIIID